MRNENISAENATNVVNISINFSEDNFSCSSEDSINGLAQWLAMNQTYANETNNCNQFSFRLASKLQSLACPARLVYGTYNSTGHAWVETKYFMVEATPNAIGIIKDMSCYNISGKDSFNVFYL